MGVSQAPSLEMEEATWSPAPPLPPQPCSTHPEAPPSPSAVGHPDSEVSPFRVNVELVDHEMNDFCWPSTGWCPAERRENGPRVGLRTPQTAHGERAAASPESSRVPLWEMLP